MKHDGTLEHDEAIAFLMKDGDLSVPCGRYGRTTSECAEVAWALYVVASESGGGHGFEALDHDMGLVVNSHDDVAYMIREYGPEYGFDPTDYLDEYDLTYNDSED